MEIYGNSTREAKTQIMDTTPPPADTQETNEHQTAIRVGTAPNVSTLHSEMYHVRNEQSYNEIYIWKFILKTSGRTRSTDYNIRSLKRIAKKKKISPKLLLHKY